MPALLTAVARRQSTMLSSGSAQLAELSLSRQSRSLGQLYEGAFSPEARGEEEPAPDRPQSQPQAGAPRTRPCHSLPRCRAADEWQSARDRRGYNPYLSLKNVVCN